MSEHRPVAQKRTARVRLLATTDLHMQLTGHDYVAEETEAGVGLTRVASLIAEARAEASRQGMLSLLFDNGDALQGGPQTELAAARPDRDHPAMRAFAHLRYDALGLGNHDFDLGLPHLETVLGQAPCPVVCSNLVPEEPGKPSPFAPYAVLDRIVVCDGTENPLRIGVLSVLPPQTVMWNRHVLHGHFRAEGILPAARRTIAMLLEQGCDIVVALAHTGLGEPGPDDEAENAALALAGIDHVDAVIAGHTHQFFPSGGHGKVDATPVVMAGAAGSHLGVIDLTLVLDDGGRWRRMSASVALLPVAVRRPDGGLKLVAEVDESLAAVLAADHAETKVLMSEPVGYARTPLHSFFTAFAPDNALRLVAAAQAAALRRQLADFPERDLPLLSAASPGKFGDRAGPGSYTDIPAGPVTLRHLIDLQVFPNDLHAVVVTGAGLADWIEMSAGLFRRIAPGSIGEMLVDPAMPGHDFDVIHGVTCEIDLSQPARFSPDGNLLCNGPGRVRNLMHRGKPVDPAQRFVVAVNSYRASGGGHFAAVRNAQHITLPRIPVRAALRDYLAGSWPRDPIEDEPRPWSFVPMPGTRVVVRTGPGAERHLHELDAWGVESSGIDADGFLRLTLQL